MKSKQIHRDFFGRELQIGDRVAFVATKYHELRQGEIVRLNEKMATIRDFEECGRYGGKYDDRVGYGLTCKSYYCIVKEPKQ